MLTPPISPYTLFCRLVNAFAAGKKTLPQAHPSIEHILVVKVMEMVMLFPFLISQGAASQFGTTTPVTFALGSLTSAGDKTSSSVLTSPYTHSP